MVGSWVVGSIGVEGESLRCEFFLLLDGLVGGWVAVVCYVCVVGCESFFFLSKVRSCHEQGRERCRS